MDTIGNPGNFEEVHFFPVSAPVVDILLTILLVVLKGRQSPHYDLFTVTLVKSLKINK